MQKQVELDGNKLIKRFGAFYGILAKTAVLFLLWVEVFSNFDDVMPVFVVRTGAIHMFEAATVFLLLGYAQM